MENKSSSVPREFKDTIYIGRIPLTAGYAVDEYAKVVQINETYSSIQLQDVGSEALGERMSELKRTLDCEIASTEIGQNCILANREYKFEIVDQDIYGTAGAYILLQVSGDWEGIHEFIISRIHRGTTWVTGVYNGKQKISLTFCEDKDSAKAFNSKEEAEYWLEINGITPTPEFTIQLKTM